MGSGPQNAGSFLMLEKDIDLPGQEGAFFPPPPFFIYLRPHIYIYIHIPGNPKVCKISPVERKLLFQSGNMISCLQAFLGETNFLQGQAGRLIFTNSVFRKSNGVFWRSNGVFGRSQQSLNIDELLQRRFGGQKAFFCSNGEK